MKIQSNREGNNYNAETAELYIPKGTVATSLSIEAFAQMKYIDHKRTDEVEAYRYWFCCDNLNPFEVKFTHKLSELPHRFSKVTFKNLTAIQIRTNVYFKADDIELIDSKK